MNLHDELGRHGADAADESARRLSSSDVREALGERVRRGRRRRAVGGGVGAVAGVALVAVGVWSVVPGLGMGDAQPASTPSGTAEGTTYEVDESAPVDSEVAIDLRRQEFLECGTDFDLEAGVTVHDTSVLDAGFSASARTELRTDDGSQVDAPSSVWVGFETLSFHHYEATDSADDLTVMSAPMVLRDGVIVGTGFVEEWIAPGPDEGREAVVRPPGECVGVDPAGHAGDGTYEPVLVTQVWSADLQEPLSTVVFSAGDIEYKGLGEATEEPEPEVSDDPAPIDPDSLPALGEEDYLSDAIAERVAGNSLACVDVLGDQQFMVGAGGDVQGMFAMPVPSWVETGRLYGHGDDALVGGYPIPLAAGAEQAAMGRIADATSARLLMRGSAGEVWVFDAGWIERDDLPHDEPGWFLELNQVWDCGSPELIEPGTYDATLFMTVDEGTRAIDLTPITVVSGVPSIPEIDEQG